jgi:hypothetical protein
MRSVLVVYLLLALVPALASNLQPFQQQALDKILATMDPQVRNMMRPQLEQTLSVLDAAQIEMMLAGMEAELTSSDDATQDDVVESVASAEDLAFNRAQYEPALRKAWAAQKAFDELADATLADACPKHGTYSVFGSAWRFEVLPLNPAWPRASADANMDIEILGASYAPQDGRYRFDFSSARDSFDKATLERTLRNACAAYAKVGDEFMRAAKSKISDQDLGEGPLLETNANAKAERIRSELEEQLKQIAPDSKNVILLAMLNGERVN